MFSMEDRRRAVDLYFTEGMTIRKVIAELGYPSEGALVKWVREDPRYTGACRRSYTLECKTNAARRALEGEPLARVARDAGCTPTSVYQWMRRYRSEGILGLMDRRNAPMPAEPMPACFASMFVRQVRQCFSVVWADGFPRCRHRFPVM
ncbi:hypothetical protein MCC01972_02410 [Bifidobacteriaceae bacterium MCC01972]|nr:hypothetical protein MCC01972_02410 [Bifidobacteriaceae bacterium MCC01972]GDY99691.1 hypothetical protein MCC01975_10230 [Bifidobacteriaceae bacterium MCC01975]